MEVLFYFSMFFSFATEMIISMILLIPRRLNFRKYAYIRIPASVILIYGVSVGLFLLTQYVVAWSIGWNIAIYTIFIVVIFLGFYNIYAFRAKETLLLILIAYTFQHILYQTVNVVLNTGLSDILYSTFAEERGWMAQTISALVQVVLYICIFVALFFTTARHYAKVSHYAMDSKLVFALAGGVYAVIVVANAYVSNYTFLPYFNPLRIALGLTFIFICVIFQLYVIWGFRYATMVREMALLESILSAKLDEHMKNEQNIRFINMKCHDLRKQIRALKARKTELSDEDFALLEESLRFYDTGIRTGDQTIDTLIQEKQLYCRSRNIEFTSLIDGSAFSKMAVSDVYFLFMNIIDNAIEAVEELEDESLRIISLTASKEKGVVVIESMNYFQGQRRVEMDGTLLSTKKDAEHHGYGSQSIAYIVHKYNGKISHDISANVFSLKIVL